MFRAEEVDGVMHIYCNDVDITHEIFQHNFKPEKGGSPFQSTLTITVHCDW